MLPVECIDLVCYKGELEIPRFSSCAYMGAIAGLPANKPHPQEPNNELAVLLSCNKFEGSLKDWF